MTHDLRTSKNLFSFKNGSEQFNSGGMQFLLPERFYAKLTHLGGRKEKIFELRLFAVFERYKADVVAKRNAEV